MTRLISALLIASLTPLPVAAGSATQNPDRFIPWEGYGASAFTRARVEQRLVLLELEAVWCHWCHVMDKRTWTDPRVIAAIRNGFVPVRVDHDARPDLAERYRRYGWPAIIILDAQGRDLAKHAGYLPPERMLALLDKVSADPTPLTEAKPEQARAPDPGSDSAPVLAPKVRAELKRRFIATHDFKLGGLRGAQKIIDRDATEYALLCASDGDAEAAAMARRDLAGARRLIDPVWGGVYQYSTGGNWDHPHYEKLGALQADYLRIFALGYAALRDPRDLAAIRSITDYLVRFLRAPDGTYYSSQDADLNPGEHAADYFALAHAERTARGIPRVDRNVYAKVNGLIADALVAAYLATDDDGLLDDAVTAVRRMIAERRLPGGGFAHGADDNAGPYLGDSLAMLRALLSLHRATGEHEWLERAGEAAAFIQSHFARTDGPGYLSAVPSGPLAPVATLDENLALARAASQLTGYSRDQGHRAIADSAMRYLVDPDVALSRVSDPGILIAADELAATWEQGLE